MAREYEVITVRLSPQQKRLVEEAAYRQRRSMNSLAVAALEEVARRVLEESSCENSQQRDAA